MIEETIKLNRYLRLKSLKHLWPDHRKPSVKKRMKKRE